MLIESEKLLYIHVPKTGGTSVTCYLNRKYNLGLEIGKKSESHFWFGSHNNHTLQHCTYSEIKEVYQKQHGKPFPEKDYKIFATIRNPYYRVLSDLFFWEILKEDNLHLIHEILSSYLSGEDEKDNHRLPQYKFLLGEEDKLNPHIHLLKTENLTAGMHKLGFTDFKEQENKGKYANKYEELLTPAVKDIIYKYYKKSFLLLGYPK